MFSEQRGFEDWKCFTTSGKMSVAK